MDLEQAKRIINISWPYSESDEDENLGEIIYELDCENKLVLNMETCEISIMRIFLYDDVEYTNEENETSLAYQKAFEIILQNEIDGEIDLIPDWLHEWGYPGSDYELGVGIVNVECSEKIIGQFLKAVHFYESNIDGVKSALKMLLNQFIGSIYRKNIEIIYGHLETKSFEKINVVYEGGGICFISCKG